MSDANIKEIFGNRLKKARIEKGITQAELSKLTTLTASTISAYEKCQKVPNLSSVSELSKALGVSIDWLCGAESNEINFDNIMYKKSIDFTELAKIIVFLGMNYCSEVEISDREDTCMDYSTGYPDTCLVDIAQLVFNQKEIVEFVSGFIKLKKIYEDGVLSKELFDTSVNGLIDKYKNVILIRYNGTINVFEELEDGEIPF